MFIKSQRVHFRSSGLASEQERHPAEHSDRIGVIRIEKMVEIIRALVSDEGVNDFIINLIALAFIHSF